MRASFASASSVNTIHHRPLIIAIDITAAVSAAIATTAAVSAAIDTNAAVSAAIDIAAIDIAIIR